MLRETRLERILNEIQQKQMVTSSALMSMFKLSEGSIRRDLNELQERGLLQKVHGGAVRTPEAPPKFHGRMNFASDNKEELAKKAMPLFKDGQLIIIDGGSTNWHVSSLVRQNLKATIFTNSLSIANSLLGHPNINLQLLGGHVFKESQITVGSDTIAALREIRADLLIMGIRSIHQEHGITSLDREDARVKRQMLQQSYKTVGLITNDKLDTADHYRVCAYHKLDILIVEDDCPQNILKKYRNKGVEIL